MAVGASVALGGSTRHQTTFGPLDEQAHYDYIVDLTHGHIPAWGDLYNQQTLRVIGCIGVNDSEIGSCGVQNRNAKVYDPDGYDYEAQQPPLGYLPFLLVASPNAPPRQAIASMRKGGTIWTAISAVLLVIIAAVEDLSLMQLVALLSISLLGPLSVYASATVTNDSAAISAGALAILTGLVANRRNKRMAWAGLIVGLVLGLMKGLFVFAPLALLVAGLLAQWSRANRPTRRDLVRDLVRDNACYGSMFIGAWLSYIGWIVFQDQRAIVPQATVIHALQSFSMTAHPQWATILMSIQEQFSLLLSPLGTTSVDFVWELAVLGTIAGIIFLRKRADEDPWVRPASIGIVVGLVALAIFFPMYQYLEGHYNFYGPPRYGLPMLPIVALVIVRSVRSSGLVTMGVILPSAAAAAQLLPGHL